MDVVGGINRAIQLAKQAAKIKQVGGGVVRGAVRGMCGAVRYGSGRVRCGTVVGGCGAVR